MVWHEIFIPFLAYKDLVKVAILCKKMLEGLFKALKQNLSELISQREDPKILLEMQKIHGKVENFAQLRKLLWISKPFKGETHYNLDYKRMVALPVNPPKIPNFSESSDF